MGYDIYIGNAAPRIDEEDLYARFKVEPVKQDDAPFWPNPIGPDGKPEWGDMSGKSNGRHPGYCSFAEWSRETGLYELFLGEEGLLKPHPGCQRLTKDHLEQVCEAREEWQKTHTGAVPGWHDHEDATLAKLIWYEWWMAWALKNCRIPAISNS